MAAMTDEKHEQAEGWLDLLDKIEGEWRLGRMDMSEFADYGFVSGYTCPELALGFVTAFAEELRKSQTAYLAKAYPDSPLAKELHDE
jgi:hypothetical protein